MKRYIMILAVAGLCLQACELESAQSPTRERYKGSDYVADMTENFVVFPMAMMETALNIETYLNASPEEKVEMTYIFNSLVNNHSTYTMKNFHGFHLVPDGNSIHETGAEWKMTMQNHNSYRAKPINSTLKCAGDGVWEYHNRCSGGEVLLKVTCIADAPALFSWDIEVSGSFTSGQGRIVEILAPGNIRRDVNVSEAGCTVTMEGTVVVNVYSPGQSALLDTFTYKCMGSPVKNQYYQL